ncbi:hypothetical protein DVH24_041477 [Malus domestica]|uniref:Uncharacterized protein n=1 Tax=Malus domestica TaxID=3750 RepID=A0A498IAX6_MALDO|nr:hypothetical protein DVH24_041477 [Malus domestica]
MLSTDYRLNSLQSAPSSSSSSISQLKSSSSASRLCKSALFALLPVASPLFSSMLPKSSISSHPRSSSSGIEGWLETIDTSLSLQESPPSVFPSDTPSNLDSALSPPSLLTDSLAATSTLSTSAPSLAAASQEAPFCFSNSTFPLEPTFESDPSPSSFPTSSSSSSSKSQLKSSSSPEIARFTSLALASSTSFSLCTL